MSIVIMAVAVIILLVISTRQPTFDPTWNLGLDDLINGTGLLQERGKNTANSSFYVGL